MPDKINDTKIIKALKEILELMLSDGDLQRASTISNTIDLINRLQAENEELKNVTSAAAISIMADIAIEVEKKKPKFINEIKAEAYKECIEKVKEKSKKTEIVCSGALVTMSYAISNKNLDNLLKELGAEEYAS